MNSPAKRTSESIRIRCAGRCLLEMRRAAFAKARQQAVAAVKRQPSSPPDLLGRGEGEASAVFASFSLSAKCLLAPIHGF
jgi:hypothetical protein